MINSQEIEANLSTTNIILKNILLRLSTYTNSINYLSNDTNNNLIHKLRKYQFNIINIRQNIITLSVIIEYTHYYMLMMFIVNIINIILGYILSPLISSTISILQSYLNEIIYLFISTIVSTLSIDYFSSLLSGYNEDSYIESLKLASLSVLCNIFFTYFSNIIFDFTFDHFFSYISTFLIDESTIIGSTVLTDIVISKLENQPLDIKNDILISSILGIAQFIPKGKMIKELYQRKLKILNQEYENRMGWYIKRSGNKKNITLYSAEYTDNTTIKASGYNQALEQYRYELNDACIYFNNCSINKFDSTYKNIVEKYHILIKEKIESKSKCSEDAKKLGEQVFENDKNIFNSIFYYRTYNDKVFQYLDKISYADRSNVDDIYNIYWKLTNQLRSFYEDENYHRLLIVDCFTKMISDIGNINYLDICRNYFNSKNLPEQFKVCKEDFEIIVEFCKRLSNKELLSFIKNNQEYSIFDSKMKDLVYRIHDKEYERLYQKCISDIFSQNDKIKIYIDTFSEDVALLLRVATAYHIYFIAYISDMYAFLLDDDLNVANHFISNKVNDVNQLQAFYLNYSNMCRAIRTNTLFETLKDFFILEDSNSLEQQFIQLICIGDILKSEYTDISSLYTDEIIRAMYPNPYPCIQKYFNYFYEAETLIRILDHLCKNISDLKNDINLLKSNKNNVININKYRELYKSYGTDEILFIPNPNKPLNTSIPIKELEGILEKLNNSVIKIINSNYIGIIYSNIKYMGKSGDFYDLEEKRIQIIGDIVKKMLKRKNLDNISNWKIKIETLIKKIKSDKELQDIHTDNYYTSLQIFISMLFDID